MGNVIYSEFLKLKRYSVITACFMMMVLSLVFAAIPLFANDATVKDFTLLLQNLLECNCLYFSPLLFSLLGICMMEREYSDDTSKNLLTIPLSFRTLVIGKLFALACIAAGFGIISALLGVMLGFLLRLPMAADFHLFFWILRIALADILVLAAVLPIIVFSILRKGAALAGVPAAFVYGFLATIDWPPMNFYPAKAPLILLLPGYGANYDFIHYSKPVAAFSLLLALLLSLFLILFSPVRQKQPQSGKPEYRPPKGWL